MKRFDRHFLGMFVQSLVIVLALITTVFLVVDVLLNLDKIQNFPDPARGTALFYAFNLPPILYLLYPFMVIAAGMFAVARLIHARELLLLEAAGVSRKRALAAIMIPALLLGVLGLGLRQFAIPDLADAARESPYGAFEFRKGKRISVRDDGGNVWFVQRYNLDTRTIEDVRILSAEGTRMIVADEMYWDAEEAAWWSPTIAEIYDISALTSVEGTYSGPATFEGYPPYGELFPADFARRRRSYTDRPLHDMWAEAWNNPEDAELQTALWHELWHPFTGFILLSVGVGLILSRQGRGAFKAGSLALGAVVGYQILQFWFETLGQAGAFPPMVGASITPVLFSILAAIIFART